MAASDQFYIKLILTTLNILNNCLIRTLKQQIYMPIAFHFFCLWEKMSLNLLSGLVLEVPKPAALCKRHIRPALAVSVPVDRILPDKQICHKSVCLILHPFPPTHPITTQHMTDTMTQTKTRVTSSRSERPRNRNPKLPIPEVTSKVSIHTWTTSVSVYYNL